MHTLQSSTKQMKQYLTNVSPNNTSKHYYAHTTITAWWVILEGVLLWIFEEYYFIDSCYCTFPMTITICTCLSHQSVFLYQLQMHSQHEYTISCVFTIIHSHDSLLLTQYRPFRVSYYSRLDWMIVSHEFWAQDSSNNDITKTSYNQGLVIVP